MCRSCGLRTASLPPELFLEALAGGWRRRAGAGSDDHEGGGAASGAEGARGGGLGEQVGVAVPTAAHSGGAGVPGSGRGGPRGLASMRTLLTLA